MSNIHRMRPTAIALGIAAAAALGAGCTSASSVTDDEATQFIAQMKEQGLAGSRTDDHLRNIVEAVCRQGERGSSYGEISSVVANYISADPGSTTVDTVTSLAFSTSCPEFGPETTAAQPMVTVAPDAVQEFVAQVRAQGLAPETVTDDELEFTVTNTCRLAGTGQSYGDLSSGIADTLGLPPGGSAVDDVMTLVYDVGCPDQR
jgi:hypothetical protein